MKIPHAHARTPLATITLLLLLSACGGGGGGDDVPTATEATPSADIRETAMAVSDSQRITAATNTANSSSNACSAARPFYWEVGDSTTRKASGSVKSSSSSLNYTSTLSIPLASATKWLYGSYVAQRRNGQLSADDVRALTMRSGYASLRNCLQDQTVAQCMAYADNGVYTPNLDGRFYYNGGHLQKHGIDLGLGPMNDAQLTSALPSQLGSDIKLGFTQPQLAGGAYASPDVYAKFLRKILAGQLKMRELLGSNAACTNPATCDLGSAFFTPVPTTESWHYSITHWVEDDPVTGDGAFSSPGALGFYPWIDASKTWYGVVARSYPTGFWGSVQCGRAIRKAWVTGMNQ